MKPVKKQPSLTKKDLVLVEIALRVAMDSIGANAEHDPHDKKDLERYKRVHAKLLTVMEWAETK